MFTTGEALTVAHAVLKKIMKWPVFMHGYMKQFLNIHVGLSIVMSTVFSRPVVAGAVLQAALWLRHSSIDWLIQHWMESFRPS